MQGIAMFATTFDRSTARDGVAFDEGPHLIARHADAYNSNGKGDAAVEVLTHAREDDDVDDSVAMVFSADTGAGRAHTPQRLNRTNTPQRYVRMQPWHAMKDTESPYDSYLVSDFQVPFFFYEIKLCKYLMYHAACKVEFQPFTRSYSQLTFFNFL